MTTEERPLSPHFTIYRWPITMTLSILHRITGVALSVGLVLFVTWLATIAWPSLPFDALMRFLDGAIGQALLFGWSFAFFFHLANGVRHLVWDTGRLLDRSAAETSAWFVIVAAVLMTVLFWISQKGGA